MKRIRKLCASSPQGIIFTNGRDEITHWNQAVENIFGWTSREAIGRKLREIIESQSPEIAAHWEDGKDGDLPLQGKVVSSGGETHLVEFLFSAREVDEQGEPYRIVIANDISHQWLREEHLQQTLRLQAVMNTILHVAMLDQPFRQQLQMLLELILSIPSLKVLPRGAILIAEETPRHLRLMAHKGLTPEHAEFCSTVPLGRCFCGRAAVKEVVSHEGNFVLSPESAKSPCRSFYPEAVHYSIPIRTETRVLGVLVLFLARSAMVAHPDFETMLALANVLAAVVDREEMRREQSELIEHLRSANINLREEKKFSESIIASLRNGLLILDGDGLVVACNPEGRRLLGLFFTGGIEGRRFAEIVGVERAEVMLADNDLSPAPDGLRQTIELATLTGGTRILEYVNSARVDNDGRRLGRIISLADITEADRLLRKMEKVNRFGTIAEIASAVAHEVRNPLAGIKALSQGVESRLAPDDRNRLHLGRIISQVDRVNDLLTDFFTYARPCKPQKRPVYLAEIVGKVIVLLSSRAQKNSISIVNRLDHQLPAVVVDPNQMQQVFLNILLNALEAVKDHGEIEITAENIGIERKIYGEPRFSGLIDGVPYLVVRIRDSGEGMPSEVREKLFEPFFSTKTTGTGLGLAIVTRIMAEHDAFIHAESVLRRGTSIFLFFRTI